jgi:hypothetical protein
MIRYIADKENKTIELLSGGSISELKDLCKKYKGWAFEFSTAPQLSGGVVTGLAYSPIISKIEHI